MFEALMVSAPHEQVNREIRPYNHHALLYMVTTYTCISTQDIVSFPCFIFIINESQCMYSSATCFPYSTLHF